MPHIPLHRFGQLYTSLAVNTPCGLQGNDSPVEVSQANAGLIRRDLRHRIPSAFESLQHKTTSEMIAICREAGEKFLHGDLPVADGVMQSPSEYQEAVAAGCGLPLGMVQGNMAKMHHVLSEMSSILQGLTRGLAWETLDSGIWEQNDLLLSFIPATTSLGVVLPSNSPGVNSLWLPAVALRIPVVLKPGRDDPWTPWRIMQAFLTAGCPPEAFAFYAADHEGSATVLEECGRAILFGDQATVDRYADQPAVSVHGPGYSKVLIGEDKIDDWPTYLDVLADSVCLNSGRSCVNASTIVVPRHGRAIAEALSRRVVDIQPRSLEDPQARLAAFVNPAAAQWTDRHIDSLLGSPGAVDCTAGEREGARLVESDGMTFLLPTIVFCEDKEHPLAKTEFLMPYAAVVEMPQVEMLSWIGPTLVATIISGDDVWLREGLGNPSIDRLNLGAIPTPVVKWDQPHEGNLFEFLYRRRAIQDRMPA